MPPFEAGAHWMRSLHYGRDDRVFGRDDRVFGRDDGVFGRDDRGLGQGDRAFRQNGRQRDLAEWHFFVILRERSEPKDLLGCATFRGRCPLDETPPLRSG